MLDKDYLQKAMDRARLSFEHGEFPAGCVVVDEDEEVFESHDSFGWNHGEAQAIDKGLTKHGPTMSRCTLYTTMMPCIGCLSKAYWAGIRRIVYILGKDDVNSHLCYEGEYHPEEVVETFHNKIELLQNKDLYDAALAMYKNWQQRVMPT
ncbi:nucleoside deaminase [candidate division WWE3 bacterium]|uniref:Nucleoside deaminase n=1 Tax=candidate division WWE3 bacterium TaxID=2053526 RepID=A0A955LKM9_UNCKA|nr:nucleoside deaminase [candidate division WWE3 bacterium]